ncbi:lipopolysaccharide biosynthesis protein RfbH [Nitrosophilus alvini]|uniref:lipopolysaccharide biosynthesis protein RfbH n=1 Tax=Nitrosophilus alvini TaxID=2714855 RepID=UPI003B833BD1
MMKDRLKKEIFEKIVEYYKSVHKPEQEKEFIPGQSRVNYAGRIFDEHEMINLIESGLDFWLTFGKYAKEFEAKLADFLGVRYVLSVNSGSSANLLAFFALTSPLLKDRQIQRGDEVITVAAGFPTTVAPIVQFGAIPVFVDMELDTFNIDPNEIEKAVSPKTKAIMIAHTLGNPFDIERVKNICDKYNLWLIEDNCDALGSRYKGKYTGTWGDIGTSSFYPPHHITMGEGGAVYTNDPLLKKIMLSLRDWGRDCWCESGVDNTCGHRFSQQFGSLPKGYDHKYVYSHFGFNLKITDMQAAIGVAQLDKLPYFIKKREKNWQKLYEGLKNIDKFVLVTPQRDSDVSWFGFLITLKDNVGFNRNELVKYLEEHNIQTRNLFAGNMIRHPMFESLEKGKDYKIIGDLKNTDKIMRDSFWLGVYPGIKDEAIEYMIEKIQEFVKNH